jgi:anti-anti-sigma factor
VDLGGVGTNLAELARLPVSADNWEPLIASGSFRDLGVTERKELPMTIDRNDREVCAGTLSIQTHHDGSTCTVALAGELDLANAEEFSAELERAETDGLARCEIVLDMTELEFIDSTGIAILIAVHHRLNVEDDRFKLVRSQALAVRRGPRTDRLGRSDPRL